MIPMMRSPMMFGGSGGIIGVRSSASISNSYTFSASADDLIIVSAWNYTGTGGAPPSTPTGYTAILAGKIAGSTGITGAGLSLGLFWKRAVGGETSVTISADTVSIVVYKSTGGTASVGANQGSINLTYAASASAPSYAAVGPLQNNSWIHAVGWANLSGGGITRSTTPSGLTLAVADGVGAQYNTGAAVSTWASRTGGAFPGACEYATYSIEIATT